MTGQYESIDRTLERRKRAATRYPEMASTDPNTVLKVDAYTSARNGLPTQFTQDAVSTANFLQRSRTMVNRALQSGMQPEDVGDFGNRPGPTRMTQFGSGETGAFSRFIGDELGRLGGAAKRTYGQLTDAEQLLNIGPDDERGIRAGSAIVGGLESIPVVGGPLATAFRIGGAPVTLATAGAGPAATRALAGPGAGRAVGRALVEPISRGGFATRLASETALGTGVAEGTEALTDRGVAVPLALAGGLVAGAAGIGAVRGIGAGVRALDEDAAATAIRRATGALDTGVGDLPLAPARGAMPSPGAVDPVIPGVTPKGRAGIRGAGDVVDDAADALTPPVRPQAGDVPEPFLGSVVRRAEPEPVRPTQVGMTPEERAFAQRAAASQGGSVQPTAQRIVPARNQAGWASGSPELRQSVEQVQDALRVEIQLRRSGVIEAEKAAGRARQAAGIEQGIAGAQSADEMLQAARQGARVGSLRQTFPSPIEISSTSKKALSDYLVQSIPEGRTFDKLRGLDALDRLLRGENVQPGEIRLLARVFGDDFAKLAADANLGRPSAVAQLSDEAKRVVDDALKGEREIVRYEQRAVAQAKHADDLMEQYRLNPTDRRLQDTAIAARAKGLEFQNRADELLIERGRDLTANLEASASRRTRTVTSKGGLTKGAQRRLSANVAAEKALTKSAPDTEQTLIREAKELLGDVPGVSAALDREAIKTVDYWVEMARMYRNAIGETNHVAARRVAAGIDGSLADSYLSSLYQQRLFAVRALEQSGTDPILARQVADLLVESQLKARYPGGIPRAIQQQIDKVDQIVANLPGGATAEAIERLEAAKTTLREMFPGGTPQRILDEIDKTRLAINEDQIDKMMSGFAAFSQEWKNLAFGPLDFGIAGQQGFKAVTSTGTMPILTGLANRTLGRVGLSFFDDPLTEGATGLARRIQYARDGLGVAVNTGAVQPGQGIGLLGRLGAPGRAAERWIEFNTRLQFDKVLGTLRELDYEGNLAILNALGRDVSDPTVRATAARFANTATSYAPGALNARRAAAETALMMTPSMRRAQVANILEMGKVFAPGTSTEARLLGAILIVNKAAIATAIGVAANQAFGVGDFQWDRSKPAAGNITTGIREGGSNLVVNLFPQEQVLNTVMQSIRLIGEANLEDLGKAWAKLGMSTAGPALGTALKAAGWGYQPGKGYQFGEWGEGMSAGQRGLALAPLPPIVGQAAFEELGPASSTLETFGVQNYPESGSAASRDNRYQQLEGRAQFEGIASEAWRIMGNQPAFQRATQQYQNMGSWAQSIRDQVRAQARAAGLSPAQAEEEADAAVQSHPTYKAYLDLRQNLRTRWVVDNIEEAVRFWNEERVKPWDDRAWEPTREQKDIMNSWLETRR